MGHHRPRKKGIKRVEEKEIQKANQERFRIHAFLSNRFLRNRTQKSRRFKKLGGLSTNIQETFLCEKQKVDTSSPIQRENCENQASWKWTR